MNYWRRLIAFIIVVVLTVVGSVNADMVPVSQLDAKEWHSQCTCSQIDLQYINSFNSYDSPSISGFGFCHIHFLPKADVEVGQSNGMENSIDLTGGPSSVSLCLYALLGLGLCSSPHLVRKLSLGHIPEWYHSGGPFQIGHSHALGPNIICSASACFIQPNCREVELIHQYHQRVVMSLWRKSQYTPDVIASRGPPNIS